MKKISKNLVNILKTKQVSMNLLKATIALLLIFSTACSTDDESCGYEEICISNQPNSEFASFTVATCYSRDLGGDVAVIYDTRFNSQAPLGDDWATTTTTTQVTAMHPLNWKASEIGQVFGIAIDNNKNIYLASSDIYFDKDGFGAPEPSTSSGNAIIYKCSPPNFTAIPFITLPSSSDALNDIGNIAYDKINNQLFATNLEDGKIYRITGLNSAIGTAVTFDPWAVDDGLGGIVNQDERVWAIGVNYEAGSVKVYFPRVKLNNTERSIYSITLNPDGSFPIPSSEVREIANVPGSQRIISDIAFSSNFQEMLLAERGHPHQAKVISYTNGGTWGFNKKYFIGGNLSYSDHDNSAGGIDFAYKEVEEDISAECDVFFWATGNYLIARNASITPLYGFEGIEYSGNNSSTDPFATANQDTDLFIDFDGIGGVNFKGTIGDVEVFDAAQCFNLCDF